MLAATLLLMSAMFITLALLVIWWPLALLWVGLCLFALAVAAHGLEKEKRK